MLRLEQLESRLLLSTLDSLRITEIMYNPAEPSVAEQIVTLDNEEFEFIELKNIGTETLDLNTVSFVKIIDNTDPLNIITEGIDFDFSTSNVTSLAPGEFAIVVENQAAFDARYPGISNTSVFAGQYTGGLGNTGERIKLIDGNDIIIDFAYDNSRGWPQAADGAGHSLVPLDAALPNQNIGSVEYGGNWRASGFINGSPGMDDPEPERTVVINEIMAHTDDPVFETNDWVELYNKMNQPVNLDNWFLSDDSDTLRKWAIPDTTTIAANGLVDFEEVADGLSFGLNKAGETLFLSYMPGPDGDPQNRVVDVIRFKGQENETSLGRFPDGGDYWFAQPPTQGTTNQSPNSDIVISEIMYHPLDGDREYIILENPTDDQIQLQNIDGTWRLTGGITFSFDNLTAIAAHDILYVVGFDPSITADLEAFQTTYETGPLIPEVDIVGPYLGFLSNSGERISLERPQAPDDPLIDPSLSWVIVDEVIFFDQAPWPLGADGTGEALERISPDQSGNDPDNWQATEPENILPQIGSVTLFPDPVTQNEIATLTAFNVSDSDGFILEVQFYRDSNGNNLFDDGVDELLGIDTSSAGGWNQTFVTTNFPIGINRYFVRAMDDRGDFSNTVTVIGEILPNMPPVIDLLTGSPDPVIQGENLNLQADNVTDPDGNVSQVVFYLDSNGNSLFDEGIDEIISTDNNGADGWSWTGSTAAFSAGDQRFFARAQDDDDEWSDPVSTVVSIELPNIIPTIDALFSAPESLVQGDFVKLTATNVADADGVVSRVEFYVDSNANGLIDPGTDLLIAEVTQGTENWSWTGKSTDFPSGAITYLARAQDNDNDWSDPVSAQGTIIAPDIIVGHSDSRKVIYTDTDGSIITLQVANGVAKLNIEGQSLRTSQNGSTITLSGTVHTLNIELNASSSQTAITFKVKGGDNQTVLNGLTGDSLGKLTGKQLVLDGDIELAGSLDAAALQSLAADSQIITALPSAKGFQLKAVDVGENVVIELAGVAKSIQANHFASGRIDADEVGQVKIKEGDFGADIWARTGSIAMVSAPEDITGKIIADQVIKKIVSKAGDFTGIARAGKTIDSIQTVNLDNAILSAREQIKKAAFKGDIIDSYILAGYDIGSDGAFGTILPGGEDHAGGGTIISLAAKGTFRLSYVGAGTLPPSELTEPYLPNLPIEFGSIDKIKFGDIDFDAAVDFGLYAVNSISPFKIANEIVEPTGSFQIEVIDEA